MITRDNFTDVLNNLSSRQVREAINAAGDWVLLNLHIFNAGSVVSLESMQYNEEIEDQANATGNLFCDKDTFLQLVNEAGITYDL